MNTKEKYDLLLEDEPNVSYVVLPEDVREFAAHLEDGAERMLAWNHLNTFWMMRIGEKFSLWKSLRIQASGSPVEYVDR